MGQDDAQSMAESINHVRLFDPLILTTSRILSLPFDELGR